MTWTKGFKATDCEGEDVVGLLREAIKRREVRNEEQHHLLKHSPTGSCDLLYNMRFFLRNLIWMLWP